VVLGLEERVMLASSPAVAAVALAPSFTIPSYTDYQGLSVKRLPGFFPGLTIDKTVITPDNLATPYDTFTVRRQVDNKTVDYWAVTLNKLDSIVLTLNNPNGTLATGLAVRIWKQSGDSGDQWQEVGKAVSGGQFSYVAGANGTYILGISTSANTTYKFHPEPGGKQTTSQGQSPIQFLATFNIYPGSNTNILNILTKFTDPKNAVPWPTWTGPQQTAFNTLTTIATNANNRGNIGIVNFSDFEHIIGTPTLMDVEAWLTNTWKPFADILDVAPDKGLEMQKAEYIYNNTDNALLKPSYPTLSDWLGVATPFIDNQSSQNAYVAVHDVLAQANLDRSNIDAFLTAMVSWKDAYQIVVGNEPTRIAGALSKGLTQTYKVNSVPQYGWLMTLLGSATTILSGIVNVAGGGPGGALISSILLNAIVNPIDAWLRGDFTGGTTPIDPTKLDTSTDMSDAAALIQRDSTQAFEASFDLLSSKTFETSLWSNYGLLQAMTYAQFSAPALGAPTPKKDPSGNPIDLTPTENDLQANYDASVWEQLLPKMFHWQEMPYTDNGPANTLRNFSFFVPLKETARWQQFDFLPPGVNDGSGGAKWGYAKHTLFLDSDEKKSEERMAQRANHEVMQLESGQPFNYRGQDLTPTPPYPNGPWFGPGPISFPDAELHGNSGSLYTITTKSQIEETMWRHEPSIFGTYWRTDASLDGDTIHEWALVTTNGEQMGQFAADQLFGTGSLSVNTQDPAIYYPGQGTSSYTPNFNVQSGGLVTRYEVFSQWGQGVTGFSGRSFKPQTYSGQMSLGKVPTNPYIPSDWTSHFDNYYAKYTITYGKTVSTRRLGRVQGAEKPDVSFNIAAFVTTLFREQLGRNPRPVELQLWARRIVAGGVTPLRLSQAIWNSPEHRALVNSHTALPISLAQSFFDAIGAALHTRGPTV
jgi:hypothetical protein